MSKFFKSVWFKCIFVLLAIALVSGGLLAVFNDVLYITPKERTGRAIKKIYGEKKEYSIVFDKDNGDDVTEYDFGAIEKYYTVGEDKLFKATGYNGYKNGTVTLWIKVTAKDGKNVIDKVILESYEKQTLMSKLGNDYYDGFLKDVTDSYFTVDANGGDYSNPVSGATKSATAGINAVNCVIKFLGGEK